MDRYPNGQDKELVVAFEDFKTLLKNKAAGYRDPATDEWLSNSLGGKADSHFDTDIRANVIQVDFGARKRIVGVALDFDDESSPTDGGDLPPAS